MSVRDRLKYGTYRSTSLGSRSFLRQNAGLETAMEENFQIAATGIYLTEGVFVKKWL
jgi:hypothetical protein